jgi:dTMP kinase
VIGSFVVLGGLLAIALAGFVYVRDAKQTADEQRAVAESETARTKQAETEAAANAKQAQQELEEVTEKERLRAAAEAKAREAEQKTRVATKDLETANVVVKDQQEDLAKKAVALQAALSKSQAETHRAEAATKEAKAFAAKESARAAALEDKLNTLARKLK